MSHIDRCITFINNCHKLDDNNKDGDDNNGDEEWETRAEAQDADASQPPGTFFILFSTFLILH